MDWGEHMLTWKDLNFFFGNPDPKLIVTQAAPDKHKYVPEIRHSAQAHR